MGALCFEQHRLKSEQRRVLLQSFLWWFCFLGPSVGHMSSFPSWIHIGTDVPEAWIVVLSQPRASIFHLGRKPAS